MTAGNLLLLIWAGIVPGLLILIVITSACVASITASRDKARERSQRLAMGMPL